MKPSRAYALACAASLALVGLAYANHFANSFHFDDAHAVERNLFIRDVRNIPRFFTSATYFSALPTNSSYRPLVTTTLAIDYAIGGLYNWPYHVDSFSLFVLQCVLMLLWFRRLVDASGARPENRWIALFAAALYGVHTVNAETVNYIIARSEILSTLGVVAGLWLRASSARARRWHLYLVPAALGMLAKESATMFAPLLLLQIALFEAAPGDPPLAGEDSTLRRLWRAVPRSLPAFATSAAFGLLALKLAPKWSPGGSTRFGYLLAQPFVFVHYLVQFALPLRLSADTDWTPLKSPFDDRVIVGLAILVPLAVLAWRLMRAPETRPAAFGLAWFFVTLVPTSIVPLAEVTNDHRMYFPLVGLVLSAASGAALWLRRRAYSPRAIATVATAVLVAYAWGVHVRNQVWRTEETLWSDVVDKSPENPRGQMNYGLSLMARGDYRGARGYFDKALQLAPYYGYAHVNYAIAVAALGEKQSAEEHFNLAMRYAPDIPGFHFFYARYLEGENRLPDAARQLREGIRAAPNDADMQHLLLKVLDRQGAWKDLADAAAALVRVNPGDPEAEASLAKVAAHPASAPPANASFPPSPAPSPAPHPVWRVRE